MRTEMQLQLGTLVFAALFAPAGMLAQVLVSPVPEHSLQESSAHAYASPVSVATLKASSRARNLMEKARKAALRQDLPEAIKQADAALALCPDYAEALTIRSYVALSEARMEGALADAQHAMKADPSLALAYSAAGSALNKLNRPDEALAILLRGYQIDHRCVTCSFELARSYYLSHDYPTAIRYLEITDALHPLPPLAHDVQFVRGYTLLALKHYEEAKHCLLAYLSAEPNSTSASRVHATLESLARLQGATPDLVTETAGSVH
jgi:tetratricopeptide (TPR) repeat protein